ADAGRAGIGLALVGTQVNDGRGAGTGVDHAGIVMTTRIAIQIFQLLVEVSVVVDVPPGVEADIVVVAGIDHRASGSKAEIAVGRIGETRVHVDDVGATGVSAFDQAVADGGRAQ